MLQMFKKPLEHKPSLVDATIPQQSLRVSLAKQMGFDISFTLHLFDVF